MRCSSATKKIGPFIDGELTERKRWPCGNTSSPAGMLAAPRPHARPGEELRFAAHDRCPPRRRATASPACSARWRNLLPVGFTAADSWPRRRFRARPGHRHGSEPGGMERRERSPSRRRPPATKSRWRKLTEPGAGRDQRSRETVETGGRWPPWPALPWWPLGPVRVRGPR